MITIHVISNAHLDPTWLWPWQAGLDEALATCRNACDRLDEHEDLIFTRSSAWVYEQIERVDPELFARIRAHVETGRWEIVGGWWVQPDCNLPGPVAMEKQIELGRRYFLDRFGLFPQVAYNVDSFGHAATLPQLMRKFGQQYYVFTRPREDELDLPARLFRWRGYEDGPEVIAFRPDCYATSFKLDMECVQNCIKHLPDGITHTMLLAGIGDHGGGPSEKQIAWLRAHTSAVDGCELVFSSTRRFFNAIADQTDRLPIVTGELQHHAIGCYSVGRQIKLAVRRAENMLKQAEIVLAKDPAPPDCAKAKLQQAWKRVCFLHFHDTIAGTCTPSAYEPLFAQCGEAHSIADEIATLGLRRAANALPDDERQRIIVFNASNGAFDDFVTLNPWLEFTSWDPAWRLLDEQGRPMPYQLIGHEAQVYNQTALLTRLQIEPQQWRIVRIDHDYSEGGPKPEHAAHCDDNSIANALGVAVGLDADGELRFCNGGRLGRPGLDLIDDPTDTWGHGPNRFADQPEAIARWDPAIPLEHGPVRAGLVQTGRIAGSKLMAEYYVYADRPFIEMRLRVNWTEVRKLLKLTLALPSKILGRTDGIGGGSLRRPCDGAEYPLHGWTILHLADGSTLGVVCPDVFAVDAEADRLRLTLLRSPYMAHHENDPPVTVRPNAPVSDQGEHVFVLRLVMGADVTDSTLDAQAHMLQCSPMTLDLTRGMPSRPCERGQIGKTVQ